MAPDAANLRGREFQWVDLSDSRFSAVDLRGASIEHFWLHGMTRWIQVVVATP